MDTQRSSRTERFSKAGGDRARLAVNLDSGGRHPDLRPSMSSDHAFSLIALRCLEAMVANEDATARGESAALHQMRISATCLKAAVSFFSPMVAGDQWRRLKLELKWLNGHLGAARDLDVVIRQFVARGDGPNLPPRLERAWGASHVRVATALKSERFRRLIVDAAAWVQDGDWRQPDQLARHPLRAMTISDYARDRLTRWREQILRRSGELTTMDPETRHQLRIKTKRLRYATEWFGEYLPGSTPKILRATLKQLRRAQSCLGELNDAERARALLKSPAAEGAGLAVPSQDKRLTRATQVAFDTLLALSRQV